MSGSVLENVDKTSRLELTESLVARTLRLRDAAALVAEQLSQPRRAIYARALELAKAR